MLDIYEPSFTRRIAPQQLPDLELSHFVFGSEIKEDRAAWVAGALDATGSAAMHRVDKVSDAVYRIDSLGLEFNLFESNDLARLATGFSGTVGVDLTSLEHRVWAPLIRAFAASKMDFIVLYAEPREYRRSNELPGAIYDLSLGLGIEPLPGFARIGRRPDNEGYFAPLLGFEGARLGHILDQEEVEAGKTSPVVGVPGFRLEYSTNAFLANQTLLEKGHMGQRIEFARANCPFEAYHALQRIHARSPGRYLRVAPIGTKPHALGAVLYAIRNAEMVELIYDHPVRAPGRTGGVSVVNCYEVSAFLNWQDSF